MTDLSNPAGQAKASGASYVERLLQTLGSRDPMTVLPATPDELQRATAGLDEATLGRPEAPGKWSVIQVVQHLADSDLVLGYRIRMIVSQPHPEIQGYDQDLWARELKYAGRKMSEALAEFRAWRESNVRLLRSLGPEELERYGQHCERGRESVTQMIRLYAAHDLVHLRQIERIKAAG